jgi:hypothetical protein
MFVISNFFTIAKTTLRAVYSKVEPNLARMALRKREIIHFFLYTGNFSIAANKNLGTKNSSYLSKH